MMRYVVEELNGNVFSPHEGAIWLHSIFMKINFSYFIFQLGV